MNWAAMLRLAVLRWGVGPEAFWRLSLAEWRMLTTALAAETPLSRAEFDRMAEAHPDSAPSPER